MEPSSRVQEITPSLTLAIDSKAKALKCNVVHVRTTVNSTFAPSVRCARANGLQCVKVVVADEMKVDGPVPAAYWCAG